LDYGYKFRADDQKGAFTQSRRKIPHKDVENHNTGRCKSEIQSSFRLDGNLLGLC